MNFLTRDLICERLRFSRRQSYRIVPPTRSGLVSSDDILTLINRSRKAIRSAYSYIPTNLLTPKDLSADLQNAVSAARLVSWATRRTKNVPPHLRFNRRTIRFPRDDFMTWLAQQSRLKELA